MPTLTHEKISKKISKKYNTQKKFFSNKKYIHKIFLLPKVCPYPRRGLPPILFTFENFVPQKSPFLRFFPILYFFMYFFGFRRSCLDFLFIFGTSLFIFGICACLPCFSIFALYRNGRGRGICSDFVFILFIFGNMIQKSLFVYYYRKKVKKSVAIKKNVVSLHCRSLIYSPWGATGTARSKQLPKRVYRKGFFLTPEICR